MRRLLFILVLAIVAIAARGQTKTFAISGETFEEVKTDYTLTNTTAQWFQFNAAQHYPCTQDFQVLLTKGTGSHTETTVTLYGRKFEDDSWVLIGTGTSGTITTTETVTISNTNQNRYRQYKVNYVCTGTGTTTISNQILKLWLE